MRRKLLFLFSLLLAGVYLHAQECDTTKFKLPQNEFNSDRGWFTTTDGAGNVWEGNLNYYEMFDACVAESNTIVITEVNSAEGDYGTYMELTNVGAEAVDLSQYRVVTQRNDYFAGDRVKTNRMAHIQLNGSLEAGESFVFMGYSKYENTLKGIMDRTDSIMRHNPLLAEIADLKYSVSKSGSYPFIMGRPYDVIGDNYYYNFSVVKVLGDTSEVVVDVFEQMYVDGGVSTIAGVPDAAGDYTLVRKQFTDGRTYGSLDFAITAGSEAAEASEWIVIPQFRNGTTVLPTTLGSHDPNSEYSVAAKEGTGIVIDEDNAIITLPWGVYKGDSVLTYLDVAADMAWEYQTNGVFEEEQSNVAQTGDTITFYHCGVDVTIKSYRIEVAAPLASTAMLVCKNRPTDFARMYFETQGLEVDTVYGGRLVYNYPVDTLMEYIEVPEGASVEKVWVDGVERPELKTGDILRVTAPDGTTTHDYFIGLVPYENNGLSHDARIGYISWPDYPVDDLDPYLWTSGDTIPGFNADANNYIITLPAGAEMIPALKAVPLNHRSTIRQFPATNLYGTVEDQTYSFVVTAEDDSTINTYNVRFVVETEDWDYEGEPFFSEMVENTNFAVITEICNPSNVSIDLSDYIVAHGMYNAKTISGVLNYETSGFYRNVKIYRPGYVYDSLTMATNQAYWFDPNGDADVDAYMEPGGVFSISANRADGFTFGKIDPVTGKWYESVENGIVEGPNMVFHGVDNTKGWDWNKHAGWGGGLFGRIIYASGKSNHQSNTFWLLKILNDSIKDGTKGVIDPADLEVIDIMGKEESGLTLGWLDPATGEPFFPSTTDFVMQRKPEVYKGNTLSMGSFGYAGIETPEDYNSEDPTLGKVEEFEWNLLKSRPTNFDIGRHTLNPVTVYKSNISSTVYKASLGISMEESIAGVISGTTGADFLANIIKLDEGQSLQLKSSTGDFIFDFDVLNDGDVLTVTSADGENTTVYELSIGELSSDLSLTSSEYEVGASSVKLTSLTLTIAEMVSNLEANENAQIYVVDEFEGLVPYTAVNLRDSSYYEAIVSEDLYIKVVAQTGATKLYDVILPATAADAYITSSYYTIDQDAKDINGVYNGTNVEALLAKLAGCEGATVEVVNKWYQVKDFGHLVYHDLVRVTSADGNNTVVYSVMLQSEEEREVGVESKESASAVSVSVMPNPTNGLVTVSSEVAIASISVLDITGKEIKALAGSNSVNLEGLSAGVYLVAVTTVDGNVQTVKVVKK